MQNEDHDEALATFQSITGADSPTAQHVLEAHSWDLNQGVNFFLEHGASGALGHAAVPAERPEDAMDDFALTNGHAQEQEFTMAGAVQEDEEEYLPPPRARRVNIQDIAAEAERRRRADPSTTQSEAPEASVPMDLDDLTDDDDDFKVVEPSEPPVRRSPQTRSMTNGRRHNAQYEESLENEDTGEDESHAAARQIFPTAVGLPPLTARSRARPNGPADLMREMMGGARSSAGGLDPFMPAGIDVEEARMLEAAMLGIPYEGRIPDFASQGPAMPEDPEVIQQRLLREEQDQAYQDSLRADREKKSAAEAAEREKEEVRLQAEMEKSAAEQAQRNYEQDLEAKLLSLPEEPAGDEEGAITVMIRTPKGGRFGRRFLKSSTLEDLFNYVDVNGAPDFKPGAYRLVTQFPRKVLSQGSSTLAEAGLSQKQEALFLEPL